MKANEKLFLIDHAFTFRYADLRTSLRENKNFIPRLEFMLKFWEKKRPSSIKLPSPTQELSLEFENMEITEPCFIKVPDTVMAISFFNNNISDIEALRKFLQAHSALRVLWLNGNPLSEIDNGEYLKGIIEKEYPKIEILNSKFTRNAGKFAVRAASLNMDFTKIIEDQIPLNSIDLSGRNFSNIQNITETFTALSKEAKELDLRDTELRDNEIVLEKLLELLGCLKSLRHLIVDKEMLSFVWELVEKKDLKKICPTLERINDTYLDYGKKR